MGVIYCILNKVNEHEYIGSAVNFNNRKKTHINRLKKGNHHSIYLQRAWDKYGENNFVFFTLEEGINNSNLIEREQWWIDNKKCKYNICKTAGNSLGVKRRKETKQKLRLIHLGKKHPKWRKEQKSISQGGKNHYNFGKKLSKKTIKKKSKSMKEKYKNGFIAPNTKPINQYDLLGNFIKSHKSVKEASNNDDKRRRGITNCLIGKNKTAYGYYWDYKLKKHIKSKRSIYKSGLPNSKPVLKFDLKGKLVFEYNSIKEAAKGDKNFEAGIVHCLKGRKKTSRGFIWKYKLKKHKNGNK